MKHQQLSPEWQMILTLMAGADIAAFWAKGDENWHYAAFMATIVPVFCLVWAPRLRHILSRPSR